MSAQPIAPVIPSPGRLAGTPRVRPAAVRPLPLAGPAAALSVPAGVVYGTGRIDAQVSAGTIDAQVDDQGRLHVSRLTAIPEPPSLVDLRKRVAAMLPRVDLPEVILEVMAWVPAFTAAFTSVSGGRTRLEDPHVSVAACLTAQALTSGTPRSPTAVCRRWSRTGWRTCPAPTCRPRRSRWPTPR